jgi:hypothetical protein
LDAGAVDAAVGQEYTHAGRPGHGGSLALALGERARHEAGGATRERADSQAGDGMIGGSDDQRSGSITRGDGLDPQECVAEQSQ